MHRSIAVLIVSFALLSIVRSDSAPLKCYMCTSSTHAGCDTDPKAHHIEPIECTLDRMDEWQHIARQHNDLSLAKAIFEVDSSQHYPVAAPMACVKMILKVNKKDVIVRNCQSAKTDNIDPCKAMQGKITNDNLDLQFCELCNGDACNSAITISPRISLTLFATLAAIIRAARA